jgi:TolB-like protein/thioredoxin-like negative regulator of GroEL
MAPEQITGDVITPAVDQYALGIVIYEMLTGLRPFRGSNDLSTAVKRLTEPAPSPRNLLPELDPRWEHVILRCLERDAKGRFPGIDDVREALIGKVDIGPPPSRRPSAARRGFLVAAAAILILALAAAFRLSSAFDSFDPGAESEIGPARTSRAPTVAIFDFRNLAGEPEVEWLSSALPEMINMELAASGELEPIADSEVAQVAASLGLGAERDFDRQAIFDVRRRLKASHLIEGSYLARDGEDGVRLHLRIYDDGPQRRILVVGRESQLADMIQEASARLRAAVGIPSSSGAQSSALTDEAALLLIGREELRKLSYQGARKVLHQALEQTPESGLTRALYARALDALGEPSARAEIDLALAERNGLPRRQQLEVEAHAAFIERRFVEASERFGALHYFYPDDPDLVNAWAESLIAAGNWQRALDLLTPSGATPNGYRELLLVARAAGVAQRFDLQLEMADKAAQEAVTRGALAAVAQAELEQARALAGLGELAPAASFADSA